MLTHRPFVTAAIRQGVLRCLRPGVLRCLRPGVLACLLVSTLPHDLAAQYEAVEVTDGAVVKGRVLFAGPVPEPTRLLITKDAEVCGEGYRERTEVVTGGGLSGVVVFIEGVESGKAWASEDVAYVLNQERCAFDPPLQVVPWGGSLEIVNSDPVLHNIHSYELIGRSRRTLFNFGQPGGADTITKELRTRRGNRVRIECDAHDFMLGWIYVADSPYYALVDADGGFEIGDIPPGVYTVSAWHPHVGMLEQEVTLGPASQTEIVFEFDGS